MKNLLSLFSILVLVVASSCSNEDSPNNQQTQNPVDVYVLGQKNGRVCYWKNNQPTVLNQTSVDSTYSKKILVSNANVHVLGYSQSSQLYWKNGVVTNLTSTFSDNSQTLRAITDMEVVGNDVYFVGYTKNPEITAEIYDLAYWKNGQKTIVAANVSAIGTSFMTVVNNDVYITSQSNLFTLFIT